jgi:glycopeptide antibiotics resistance protein
MLNKIVLVALAIIIGAVFYFSWLSDPRFLNETYLPNWLLDWSNRYYNLRTAIPFVVFGFLLQYYSKEHESLEMSAISFRYVRNVSIVVAVVCIAELGQLFIHKRSPDLLDVFFGILGSLSGALFYNLLKRLRNAKST